MSKQVFMFWLGIALALANTAFLVFNLTRHSWGLAIFSGTAIIVGLVGTHANVKTQIIEAQMEEMKKWGLS
jgi:hypothetical protein